MFCRKKDCKIIIVASSSSNDDVNNSGIGNNTIDDKNHRHVLGSSQTLSSMVFQCIGILRHENCKGSLWINSRKI